MTKLQEKVYKFMLEMEVLHARELRGVVGRDSDVVAPVIFVLGLPGSGKSSFISQYLKSDRIICGDAIRVDNGCLFDRAEEAETLVSIKRCLNRLSQQSVEEQGSIVNDFIVIDEAFTEPFSIRYLIANLGKRGIGAIILNSGATACWNRRINDMPFKDFWVKEQEWVANESIIRSMFPKVLDLYESDLADIGQ